MSRPPGIVAGGIAVLLSLAGCRDEGRRPAVQAGDAGPTDMRLIPAGEFEMGSRAPEAREDEKPVHRVALHAFWIDRSEVTNAAFARFVAATGYRTVAERTPTWEELKAQLPEGTPPPAPETLQAGSLVFKAPVSCDSLEDWSAWWSWVPGADWRHPEGPGSSIEGLLDRPVVQVAWDDAAAFAAWAGKRLPTEAEWERAARGGLEGAPYAWGREDPDPRRANLYQGRFPTTNDAADGWIGTAPVASFPANGFGLFDMAGNVWEWCADWYHVDAYAQRAAAGPVVRDPAGPSESFDPQEPAARKRVMRGGSFLCHGSYCAGYRVSARMKSTPDSAANHIGFRCVKDVD